MKVSLSSAIANSQLESRHQMVNRRAMQKGFTGIVAIAGLTYLLLISQAAYRKHLLSEDPTGMYGTQALVMKGGDPYVRALMRTISASEANDRQPYNIIYGGERVSDLSQHPARCVTITAGPNRGNCSTAAGRYQFLNRTWAEKSKRYHPQMSDASLSFAPQYQDAVIYAWLSDPQAWRGEDIPALLRQGELDRVLRLLSPTWTSLGYGIETNSMSGKLPRIYQRVLHEELQMAS